VVHESTLLEKIFFARQYSCSKPPSYIGRPQKTARVHLPIYGKNRESICGKKWTPPYIPDH
jgi:hypothetical protein